MIAKLLVLSGLRRLQDVVTEEVQHMPITIDIMENPFLRDILKEGEEKGLKQGLKQGEEQGLKQGEEKGGKQGEITLLRRMLEKKFGTLPDWAVRKLEAADLATLESWGLRLLEAGS